MSKLYFEDQKVIAAIRDEVGIRQVLTSPIQNVFLIKSNILELERVCELLKQHNKKIYVHVDMIDGMKADEYSIEYIKKHTCADGIITTKHSMIKYAKNNGLNSILRIFIIDSKSIHTGIKNVNDAKPTAVELMPALITKAIHHFKTATNVPIIVGGLIDTKTEVEHCISAGAICVSTSNKKLW